MEWSRIKTIILIILAILNGSLLFFLMQRELQNQSAQREARQNAILFLRENGVSVEDETIPQEMTLLPQTVEWDREQERTAAAVLLGDEVQEQAWSDEIYRYYNETGSIQFHRDGTFQGDFVEGAFPIGESTPSDYGLEVLDTLGFLGEETAVRSAQGEDPNSSVTYRQLWNGVPIFNHQVTLTFREGCLVTIEGRRLTGEPQEAAAQKAISVPTALFQFYRGVVTLGDVCSQIDSVTPGYVTSAGSGPSALTPVWHIVTDARSYRLDLLTGTLSRADEEAGSEGG